jgi:hypothetical protein
MCSGATPKPLRQSFAPARHGGCYFCRAPTRRDDCSGCHPALPRRPPSLHTLAFSLASAFRVPACAIPGCHPRQAFASRRLSEHRFTLYSDPALAASRLPTVAKPPTATPLPQLSSRLHSSAVGVASSCVFNLRARPTDFRGPKAVKQPLTYAWHLHESQAFQP